MSGDIFGHSWEAIQHTQRKQARLSDPINTERPGDYGADPIGNGQFRMVPSGDIVDFAERNRRLKP